MGSCISGGGGGGGGNVMHDFWYLEKGMNVTSY